jgi:hypothetical protein
LRSDPRRGLRRSRPSRKPQGFLPPLATAPKRGLARERVSLAAGISARPSPRHLALASLRRRVQP